MFTIVFVLSVGYKLRRVLIARTLTGSRLAWLTLASSYQAFTGYALLRKFSGSPFLETDAVAMLLLAAVTSLMAALEFASQRRTLRPGGLAAAAADATSFRDSE